MWSFNRAYSTEPIQTSEAASAATIPKQGRRFAPETLHKMENTCSKTLHKLSPAPIFDREGMSASKTRPKTNCALLV